jgi:outer membrane protein assembly factor BamE (lipoprotein component of BamABCDE complex)
MQRASTSWAVVRVLLAITGVFAAACSAPPPPEPEKLSVGTVQREIKAGMDQAAVREALGAPTTVSADSQRREVWTYDGVSSDRIDTARSVGGSMIVLSGAKSALASTADKRTLTIIVYYDDAKKVRDFAYNYSSQEPLQR